MKNFSSNRDRLVLQLCKSGSVLSLGYGLLRLGMEGFANACLLKSSFPVDAPYKTPLCPYTSSGSPSSLCDHCFHDSWSLRHKPITMETKNSQYLSRGGFIVERKTST